MGDKITLPTRKCGGIDVVSIPEHIFGKKVFIQAHTISKSRRKDDLCDGHDVDEVDAKGDIKFFSRTVDIASFKIQ